jgi:VWFA-related protein
MRLTSLVAAIITLALGGYQAATIPASRAAAAPQAFRQASLPPGPMGSRPDEGPPESSQTESLPQAPRPLEVQTTVVNVFATVRDKRNAILSDLTKDDFKIYEDGVEQKVAYFTKEVDMPITLGILMDTSGSMERILSAEQDAASRFVREVMRKRDEAMVISFDTDVNLLADFTQDPAVLARAIHRAQINVDASGIGGTPGTVPQTGRGTNLYDAIYLACYDQLASEAGRKAIVVLSDAEDTGSKMSMQDAIAAAQRADAVAHVLLITDWSAASGSGPGVASKLASETGGRVINVHNDKSLEKAFDEISQELRSQYVLGYYPTNSTRDGGFRKIKVEVSRPNTKVLARKGYYAPRK